MLTTESKGAVNTLLLLCLPGLFTYINIRDGLEIPPGTRNTLCPLIAKSPNIRGWKPSGPQTDSVIRVVKYVTAKSVFSRVII